MWLMSFANVCRVGFLAGVHQLVPNKTPKQAWGGVARMSVRYFVCVCIYIYYVCLCMQEHRRWTPIKLLLYLTFCLSLSVSISLSLSRALSVSPSQSLALDLAAYVYIDICTSKNLQIMHVRMYLGMCVRNSMHQLLNYCSQPFRSLRLCSFHICHFTSFQFAVMHAFIHYYL